MLTLPKLQDLQLMLLRVQVVVKVEFNIQKLLLFLPIRQSSSMVLKALITFMSLLTQVRQLQMC